MEADNEPSLASTPSLAIFLSFSILALLSAFFTTAICIRRVLHISEFFNYLLLSLTIADILSVVYKGQVAISDLTSDHRNFTCNTTSLCVVSAAISSFARLASYAWTLAIGWSCTLTILNKLHRFRICSSRIFYSLIVWGGCILIPVAGLIRGAYGRTDLKLMSLCWIRTCDTDMSWTEQFIWMMLTSKLWELLSYLMITNLLFVGLCLRRQRSPLESLLARDFTDLNHLMASDDSYEFYSSESEPESVASIKLFLWIPVCLFVCRIWTTLLFFMDVYLVSFPEPSDKLLRPAYYIQNVQAAFGCSQPTFNFMLILILHSEAREWLHNIGRSLCSICRSRSSSD